MIALFAGPYTKEDFAYIIDVLAKSERSTSCSSSCKACKHRHACADVQRLLKYSQFKLSEITKEERANA